jgi:hypothetical protein
LGRNGTPREIGGCNGLTGAGRGPSPGKGRRKEFAESDNEPYAFVHQADGWEIYRYLFAETASANHPAG